MSAEPHAWERVSVVREGGVTTLRAHTDDGPLVWDATVHRELTEAFEWVRLDLETKVVVITGSGESWCDSIDVPSFRGTQWDHLWWEGRRLLNGLLAIDVPVIGVVNGPATVHAEIPVLGDLVIAADNAKFADRAHITRGVVPGDGAHAVWARLLGPSRSKYFLLTAATIGAEEALRLGFVHEAMPRERLADRAAELGAQLAEQNLPVLRYAKAVVAMGFRRGFAEELSHGLGLEGSGHWSDGGINE
jgi:enoyl-CoA hydratase/carnithine racemase